jgi:glutathione S-transferase
MHSGFADVREQLPLDFARRVPTPQLRDATKEQITRIIGAWEQVLTRHGDVGGFLFGNFSVADCMYGPVVSRFVTYGIKVPQTVQAYMDRVVALPAMKDWGVAAQKEIDANIA